MSPTLTLHQQAEQLREQEKFTEALDIYAKVIKEYYNDKNYLGVADALGGQILTYKHLYLTDPNDKYLKLAQGSANASLEIAQKHKITDILHRCYLNLGEVEMLAKNYSSAVDNFQKSYNLLPENSVEKSQALSHLAEARYFNGDTKNVKNNLLKSLIILNKYKSQVDDYTFKVWQSGILLKLYVLTRDKTYYDQAKKIIDGDDRLIIRKRQLEEYTKNILLKY